MSEYTGQIREFFSRFLNTDDLDDSDDVFAGGYVNSLFAMQLIAWLESEFPLTVEDSDLDLNNFNSINAITEFIERKKGAQALASA